MCGKCRSQYSDVAVFLQHKKTCKSARKQLGDMPREDEVGSGLYYALESRVVEASPPVTSQLYLNPSTQLIPLVATIDRQGGKQEHEEHQNGFNVNKVEFDLSSDRETLNKFDDADEPLQEDIGSKGNTEESKQLSKESKNKKLFCSYCHKGFNKVFDLTQHTRSHTGEKPYQCVICGRGFAQKSNVKKHMATHKVWPKGHRTLPKESAGPDHEGAEAVVLASDSQDASANKDAFVRQIGRESGGHAALEAGAGTEEEEAEPLVRKVEATQLTDSSRREQISVSNCYECPYCGATSTTYPTFKTHLRQHQTEKCYRCIAPSCSKMFQELEDFLDHTEEHKDRLFRCHLCSNKFSDLSQLNLHSYTHLTDEQTREKQVFQCEKCKNKYTSAEALDHHMETSPHLYPCDLCDKEFSAERFLRKHLAVAHSKSLFECEICHKKLKNEHYLKSHLLIHTGEMPFECKDCGAKFNRKDKLKRHAQTHNPSRKFKCPFKDHMNCTKEFHRFDKLKLHIMTHGNIKPFKCDICLNGFSRKEHLNAHLQKIHHGSKGNFSCEVCKKCFDTNLELSFHMKEKHSGEKKAKRYIENSTPLPCEMTLLQAAESPDQFSCKYSEYILPDHFGAAPRTSVKEVVGPGLSLDHSGHSLAVLPYSEKSGQFCVQSAVGSAASEAMEILYSESGHGILLPNPGNYQMNV